MNFICDRGLLLDACGAAAKFVPQKTPIPALEGFLLEAKNNNGEGVLTIIGFDTEAGIEINIPCNVIIAGSLVVNAKTFTEIVRSIDEAEISFIETSGLNLSISGGSTNFTLRCTEASLFPHLPAVISEKSFTFKCSTLKKMLRQTLYAVAIADPIGTLTGAYFEFEDNIVSVTCTNRMKMARRIEPYERNGDPFSFIVPGKFLNEIIKILDDSDEEVRLCLSSKHIVFETEKCKIISRLLDGQFLNYKGFLPKEFKTVVDVKPADFRRLIERASVIIIDNGKLKTPIRLSIESEKIIVSCKNEQGQSFIDEIKVKTDGMPLEIGFNNRILIETIAACEDEEVTLNFNSSLSSLCVLPKKGNSFVFLVSPMRISDIK
ncbi:MAG: DNA polymerase III subunit beta [Clostridia bacterium]|nr:DNA polymerase III subunit beta [Clostridia bacterium]